MLTDIKTVKSLLEDLVSINRVKFRPDQSFYENELKKFKENNTAIVFTIADLLGIDLDNNYRTVDISNYVSSNEDSKQEYFGEVKGTIARILIGDFLRGFISKEEFKHLYHRYHLDFKEHENESHSI